MGICIRSGAHAYDTHQEGAAAIAIDPSGNPIAALPFKTAATFGAIDVKTNDPAKSDLALVTFDANGSVTAARPIKLEVADATPLRLLVDRQGSSIVLTRALVVKSDALGQEVYRHALAGNTVQTAVVTTNGEVTLLATNGSDDAGAPRLALVRLDKDGEPRAMTDKDRGIATGAAGSAVMTVDHCGAITLATKSAAGFTVATHVAN